VRLWSEREHADRAEQELPEIKRLDLAEVVLTLKAAGVDDLRQFRWLEAPEEKALARAEDLLLDLGALRTAASGRQITPLGRQMLAFPVHPRYARMLLAARDYGCVYLAGFGASPRPELLCGTWTGHDPPSAKTCWATRRRAISGFSCGVELREEK
jgi:ATP-dependent helicase HrpB